MAGLVTGSSCSGVAEFAYDALGRRIKRFTKHDSQTTYYYHNSNWQVLTETDADGTTQRWFIYGNYIDEVLLIKADSNDYYYAQDHLYSPAALINSSGSVVERYEYDAYGDCNIMDASYNPRSSSNYGNPYLFTGRRVDILDSGSLKIQYNRNRYYDYYTGRWLTQDPLGINPIGGTHNPFSILDQYMDALNLYEYVEGRVTTAKDPSGLFPWHPMPGIIKSIVCSFSVIDNAIDIAKKAWEARYGVLFINPLATGNPFKHCTWSCRMARARGPGFAWSMGMRKEALDCAIADLRDKLLANGCWVSLPLFLQKKIEASACSCNQFSDIFIDNPAGIWCGWWKLRKAKCSSICLDLQCKDCCNSLGITKDTEDGPGTKRPPGKRCKFPGLVWPKKPLPK